MKLTFAMAISAALTLGHPGESVAGSDTDKGSAAANIHKLFESLLKEGETSTESPISPLPPDSTDLGNGKVDAPYLTSVPTAEGLSVKTRLPITGQPDRPQKDVKEILAKVKDACTSGGGEIDRRESSVKPRAISTPVVARGFTALTASNLIGQFWCKKPGAPPLFMVEVVPAAGATVPLVPLGWDWNIAFRLVTTGALERYESQLAAYEKSVADLRSGVKVGTHVQVRTSDLPDAVTEAWRSRRRDQVGNLCGLVIEVKPPLAQVQIQSAQIAIEIEKLLPQGTRIAMDEYTSAYRGQMQTWCVK